MEQISAKLLPLRITLSNIDPPIWRRLLVTDDLTFAQLHKVIQAAMGWEDYHMHEFEAGKVRVGDATPDPFGPGSVPRLLSEKKTRLSDVLGNRRKFRYWYDFGDDWWHEIAIEKRLPDDGLGPRLLAGERACPPEDCGGPWGYANLLEILADPGRPEYEELREWAGDFEPERFDLEAAAKAVQKSVRRKKPEKAKIK
ncbi:plasmid pRiA4b ORF-3 family protein [Methylocaldum marinum]|nr:plasmid pRiA4b ORF-3 family protein [Methylocaldum marinum]